MKTYNSSVIIQWWFNTCAQGCLSTITKLNPKGYHFQRFGNFAAESFSRENGKI